MKLKTAAIIMALAGLAAGAAQAQSALNPNAPLAFSYEGEGGTDTAACVTRMNGRVEITQDRARLRADSVTAQHDRRGDACGSIRQLQARGQVFYVTPDRSVRADAASYDLRAQTVTFTGNVVTVQGQDVTTADTLTINLDTGSGTMNGRVRGVVFTDPAGGTQ